VKEQVECAAVVPAEEADELPIRGFYIESRVGTLPLTELFQQGSFARAGISGVQEPRNETLKSVEGRGSDVHAGVTTNPLEDVQKIRFLL
jgi:hypothetical protein